jgi:hypothetical protein
MVAYRYNFSLLTDQLKLKVLDSNYVRLERARKAEGTKKGLVLLLI